MQNLEAQIKEIVGKVNLIDYKTGETLRIVSGQNDKIKDHETRLRAAEKEITTVKTKQWTIASIFGLVGGAIVNFFKGR